MKSVKEMLQETGCQIIWNHSNAKGLYMKDLNCIYLSLDYDKLETKSFLYHECGHLLSEDTKVQLKTVELKQERKANDYMIESCVAEVAPDYEDCPYLLTACEIISRFNLPEKLFDDITVAIKKYLVKHNWVM